MHSGVGGIGAARAHGAMGGSRARAVLGVGSRINVMLALLVAYSVFLETKPLIGSIRWP